MDDTQHTHDKIISNGASEETPLLFSFHREATPPLRLMTDKLHRKMQTQSRKNQNRGNLRDSII